MFARDAAARVDARLVTGDGDREITGLSTLSDPRKGTLVWARDAAVLQHAVDGGLAGVTVVTQESVTADEVTQIVVTIDPRLAFAVLGCAICPQSPARVHPTAVIYDCVTLGERVDIRAGAVIGAPGFGYVRTPSGVLHPFPQIGRVLLEDDVSIGAGTTIDRGALADTVIRRGVKIDNLVHVAHGVHIGEHTLIVAGAEISGSVKIGRCCQIGPNACIREGLTVGDGAQVGIGAVVVRDVAPGEIVVGNPAEPMAVFLERRERLRMVRES